MCVVVVVVVVVVVRPVLEYGCIIWNPLFKCDSGKIESVQHQVTKHLKGLFS